MPMQEDDSDADDSDGDDVRSMAPPNAPPNALDRRPSAAGSELSVHDLDDAPGEYGLWNPFHERFVTMEADAPVNVTQELDGELPAPASPAGVTREFDGADEIDQLDL